MRRGLAHHTLHFFASVLMTSGVLLLADAGLTLAWQEPISYLIAKRQQAQLDKELADARRRLAEDLRLIVDEKGLKRLETLARLQRKRSKAGHAIGRIALPRPERSYAVVQGTDTASLRKGPGHYPQTPFPGQHGTVAIAGHRTTYLAPFKTINRLRKGDRITVTMPYARFTYAFERRRIVPPSALWVIGRRRYDRLVLSACHPKFSAAKRIVVFAKLLYAQERGAPEVAAG
jgi:sortase A